jgi:hypothetical protein
MDSQKLKVLLVVICAAFAALYLGVAAATAQMEALAWVMGIGAIIVLLSLGRHVWVLIPISLALLGNINLIPGSPAPWWVATMAVAVITVMRTLLRKTDFVIRFTWIDFAILLQVLAVGQSFIRNPTGLSILGGDVVGGKPYIIYGFAFIAFFLLSAIRTDLKMVKLVIIFTILMSFIDGGIFLSSFIVPAFAATLLPIYSGVSFDAAVSGAGGPEASEGRIVGAKAIGEAMGMAAFTLYRPISTLNPMRIFPFMLMVSSIGMIMVSGFRSLMFKLAVVAIVSSLIRRKPVDVMIAGALALFALVILVTTQSAKHLPFGAQRILSELPFDVGVESRASVDADRSSEWRFEMWKLALTTDRYIQNKLLGDGFGYRADELRASLDSLAGDDRRSAQTQGTQEAMMAKGSYHGFHVEAIRMTGVFGLLCALVGMGIFLRYAWIQIQYFRGRPEWGYVLFICVPFLIYPFYLMLVFGQYKQEFAGILVASAMIKILDNIRIREIAESRSIAQEPQTSVAATRANALPGGLRRHAARSLGRA